MSKDWAGAGRHLLLRLQVSPDRYAALERSHCDTRALSAIGQKRTIKGRAVVEGSTETGNVRTPPLAFQNPPAICDFETLQATGHVLIRTDQVREHYTVGVGDSFSRYTSTMEAH